MIVVKVIVGILMLIALARLPYGYYIALRWITAISSGISSFDAFNKDKSGWGWVFIGVAILYNPIVPVHMTKAIWMPINIATAILFFASIGAVNGIGDD